VRRMEGGRVNTWSWLEELQIPKAERDVTHLPLSLHRARPSGLPAPRGTAECNPRHHEQAHHCSSGMATGGRGNEYLIIARCGDIGSRYWNKLCVAILPAEGLVFLKT
jgi:hypothetical protein